MANSTRPPVITIMGHVDHGKTSLLDYIRQTKVTAGEAGGITQHIGAYHIVYQGTPLTFIDTPGHAAFNKMRERGARVTDIIVLVVAADDGVKPQTVESIRHIKQANVPLVVAINKIDLPNVHLDVIKGELAAEEVLVVGYGGEVESIPLSAKTGEGVDKLLATLVAMAQLNEYVADPEAPLQAVIIESSKDDKRGSSASVIVQQGTLKIRQEIIADSSSGRVRQLLNETGQSLTAVLPGFPAEVVGFDEVPSVGEMVREKDREYPVLKASTDAEPAPADVAAAQFSSLNTSTDIGVLLDAKQKLLLIVRTDVTGTLEAIAQTIDPESVELISAAASPVNERDIELAQATGAVIIAFHIKVPGRIKQMAKEAGVRMRYYDVIYQLIEDLQKQMLKFLEPTIDEVITGTAEIAQIFDIRGERIAGVKVITGEIKKIDLLHLKRGELIIANPVIKSMLHGKEEIQVIKTKNEGGLTFKNKKLDFEVGDQVIAYKTTVEDEAF